MLSFFFKRCIFIDQLKIVICAVNNYLLLFISHLWKFNYEFCFVREGSLLLSILSVKLLTYAKGPIQVSNEDRRNRNPITDKLVSSLYLGDQ